MGAKAAINRTYSPAVAGLASFVSDHPDLANVPEHITMLGLRFVSRIPEIN